MRGSILAFTAETRMRVAGVLIRGRFDPLAAKATMTLVCAAPPRTAGGLVDGIPADGGGLAARRPPRRLGAGGAMGGGRITGGKGHVERPVELLLLGFAHQILRAKPATPRGRPGADNAGRHDRGIPPRHTPPCWKR